jgi:LPS sulfotransferase NodH
MSKEGGSLSRMNQIATDAKPFVILFQGRSGSTYLVEALSKHPSVCCDIERLVGLKKAGADAQLEWIDQHFQSHAEQFRAIGFKTKLEDVLDPAAFRSLLHRRRAKVILLTRKNIVKIVISWMNAERIYQLTGDWNLYPPARTLTPFTVDVGMFERRLKLVEEGQSRLRAYAKELQLETLEFFYEDLLRDHDTAMCRAFEFLGATPAVFTGSCLKATNDNLQHAVANFHEIRQRFLGTAYQPMLEEVV